MYLTPSCSSLRPFWAFGLCAFVLVSSFDIRISPPPVPFASTINQEFPMALNGQARTPDRMARMNKRKRCRVPSVPFVLSASIFSEGGVSPQNKRNYVSRRGAGQVGWGLTHRFFCRRGSGGASPTLQLSSLRLHVSARVGFGCGRRPPQEDYSSCISRMIQPPKHSS